MADENRRASDDVQAGNSQSDNSQTGNGQQFAVQRIYVKDLSFEAPLGVNAFSQPWKPQVNQEINTKNQKIGDNLYEVTLSLTITVKLEEKVAFLVEIQQAGLFSIKGLDDKQLTQVLNTMCLQILFPYARETIDGLAIKGSFPALMLPPINFDALFAQALSQSKEKAEKNQSVN
ncbi:MAG: protein-export chaperone SecB [Cellvibrionaceae bacterium]